MTSRRLDFKNGIGLTIDRPAKGAGIVLHFAIPESMVQKAMNEVEKWTISLRIVPGLGPLLNAIRQVQALSRDVFKQG